MKNNREAEKLCKEMCKQRRGWKLEHGDMLNGQPDKAPGIDKSAGVPVPVDEGVLAPKAAQVVMKIFYAAREARPDLLRAVGHLTRFLTRWTKECDRRLHRLVEYVSTHVDTMSFG